MAPSFRRRLVCFYCGCKSTQTWQPSIRRWPCHRCEAENYLDENGEITEPPAMDISSNARFAQSIARPSSPVFEVPDETLFCSTCLKNQHLFSQSLASYFPPSDDPNYLEYEKAYPKFRRGLEERYPQVCQECEPRVQERIKATGYAAKTDHLRRMMERTRGHGLQYDEWNWKSVLIFLGGFGWISSLAGQVMWDGLAILTSGEEQDGLRDENFSVSGYSFLQLIMRDSGSTQDSAKLFDSVARVALLLGFLSSWWNPKLQERQRRKGGRLVGVQEFYKLQGLLLLVRCVAWAYIAGSELAVHTTQAAHLSMLVLGAIINFASFRSIRINYTPQIQFQESPKPLASRMTQPKNSNTDKSYTSQVSQQLHSSTSRTDAATRPFSINDFAPPTPQQYPLRYQPPTPPPEDDDDGAMDWTPSQEKQMLRPMASYRPLQSASKPSQPSPFYGRLPADVVSQAQQLRNPPNQPVFRKASAAKTTEFFLTPKKYDMRDHYNTSPSEYEPSVAATTPVLSPIKFAQPRFFPQSDHEVLGFESRMANSLSLDDEPPEVRAVHQNHAQRNLENQSALNSICAQWHRILALVLLVASRVFWSNTATTSPIVSEVHSRLVAVGVISTLCARLLFLGMRKAHWSSANILIFTFELVACGFTGAVIQEPSKISLSSLGPKARDLMGPALISWLAVQESCMLFLEVWTQRNRNNGILSSTTVHTATSARLDRNQSTSLEQAPTHTSSVEQKPVPASRRSTPLRTKLDRNSGVHNDLGGLSLDGFGRSEQASGIGSMGLGQPQRRMQNGMW